MTFFTDDDLKKAKEKKQLKDKGEEDKAVAEAEKDVFNKCEIEESFDLLTEMLKEFPKLAELYNLKFEKLPTDSGLLSRHYTKPMYNLLYDLYVDQKGVMYTYTKTGNVYTPGVCTLVERFALNELPIFNNTSHIKLGDSWSVPVVHKGLSELLGVVSFKYDRYSMGDSWSFKVRERRSRAEKIEKIKFLLLKIASQKFIDWDSIEIIN